MTARARSALRAAVPGIDLTALPFGETDDCGRFVRLATDFRVTLPIEISAAVEDPSLAEAIREALRESVDSPIGHVHVAGTDGDTARLVDRDGRAALLRGLVSGATGTSRAAAVGEDGRAVVGPLRVQLLIYNPVLRDGDTLYERLNWNDPDEIVAGTIDVFDRASEGRALYEIVERVVLDEWPVFEDGFRYDEDSYLDVWYGRQPPHQPERADYLAIVDDPRFEVCEKLNAGLIDEIWVYSGHYLGFYESRLIGPGGYWYNSPPLTTGSVCEKLLPFMHANPEREVAEATHNFGHRTESTFARAFGGWNPRTNAIAHDFEAYALVDALSSAYDYSGCGNVHYPPNGRSDYDYANPGATPTNCDDFANYPNLSEPESVVTPVTCERWSCAHESHEYFLRYWFQHLPANPGCNGSGLPNDWWPTFAFPDLANDWACCRPDDPDFDADGIPDGCDVCPLDSDPAQEDADGDYFGDACDVCPDDPGNDADGDGLCAPDDNCPEAANPGQADGDLDGSGDACDLCPLDANPDQEDSDSDGRGDVCDPCPLDPAEDADADGLCANDDNCPLVANPTQEDADGDGVGDVCDSCPDTGNPGQTDRDRDGLGDACDFCPADAGANNVDGDGDGVGDACDNCPAVPNAAQGDLDRDRRGDACDNCRCFYNPTQADADGDGAGSACDVLDFEPFVAGLCVSGKPLDQPQVLLPQAEAECQAPLNPAGNSSRTQICF